MGPTVACRVQLAPPLQQPGTWLPHERVSQSLASRILEVTGERGSVATTATWTHVAESDAHAPGAVNMGRGNGRGCSAIGFGRSEAMECHCCRDQDCHADAIILVMRATTAHVAAARSTYIGQTSALLRRRSVWPSQLIPGHLGLGARAECFVQYVHCFA